MSLMERTLPRSQAREGEWYSLAVPYNHPILVVYILKYGLAAVAAWGGIAWRSWSKRRAELAAQTWHATTASIHTVRVAPIEKTRRYLATITYSYFVEEYRVGTYTQDFSSEGDADEFARQLRGKSILIRYNPTNPDRSVLEARMVENAVLLHGTR